jgi:hypothetical protein
MMMGNSSPLREQSHRNIQSSVADHDPHDWPDDFRLQQPRRCEEHVEHGPWAKSEPRQTAAHLHRSAALIKTQIKVISALCACSQMAIRTDGVAATHMDSLLMEDVAAQSLIQLMDATITAVVINSRMLWGRGHARAPLSRDTF